MSRIGGITLKEWKKPPGPPFSPVICVLPHIIGNSKSHLSILNLGGISIALMMNVAPFNASFLSTEDSIKKSNFLVSTADLHALVAKTKFSSLIS